MKHIHLIGIGGSGLSAIARLLKEMGYTVSGSDRAETPFLAHLKAAGVILSIGHHPENIAGADLVVRSSAISDDNPEVLAAQAAGIPVLKRSDFLGHLMTGKTGIAVAGTHGKTTSTAMLAWVLTALGQEPSFIVGGVLNNLGTNARAGSGKTFVIEADEYDRMFLGLKPVIAVVTNVEHDHPDCYPTPADFQAAFLEFVNLLPSDGVLVACAEDAGAKALLAEARKVGKRTAAYGISDQLSVSRDQLSVTSDQLSVTSDQWAVAKNLHTNERGGFSFEAIVNPLTGTLRGRQSPNGDAARSSIPRRGRFAVVNLQVPGEHNVRNALAVLSVVYLLGLPLDAAAEALGQFTGTGRRFEVRGEANGIVVIDDYAHHPTEIRATLAAARSRYARRRLWAVWQPHTYSRTQTLFAEFSRAFTDADQVIVTEVYAAREQIQDFSAAQVVKAMPHPSAHFIPNIAEVSNYLVAHLRPGDVLLVLSAGDADLVSTQVLASLQNREARHA
ncbi:MAG: UDP-N-acetylmuramate--L-alanine ligase [Anaerolineales bacterium]|nr:UDP-N-acetylmuramate--L-alanine ligase [Anaerolineales bacterium]